MAEKKRDEPQPVGMVEIEGVRYEAPMHGSNVGIPQDGGVVAAFDRDTGRLLWAVSVYEAERDPDMEEDKQDVFIRSMDLDDSGMALIIVNERGDSYRLHLETREVTRLPSDEC